MAEGARSAGTGHRCGVRDRDIHRATRRFRAGVVACAWCLAACVKWEPVAPPAPLHPRAADAPGLPRWVRVTTRDSARYLLEGATFRGDTLVGNRSGGDARGAPAPLARVPAADIAHVEARVPSLAGSVGMAAVIVAGVWAFAWSLGHAAIQ